MGGGGGEGGHPCGFTHSLLGDHHHVVCYCEGVDVTPAIVICGCDTCYCEGVDVTPMWCAIVRVWM